MTLWNQGGTTKYCYSDDFCGNDANISWTAPFNGTVRVLVSQYNCVGNSTGTTLRWRRALGALPDLQAPEAQWQAVSVNEGASFWVAERIYNGGSAAAGASFAKLYLSTDNDFDVADDYYVGENSVGALASGESEWVQWDFTMPDIGSGSYSVWMLCVVDAQAQITESDKNNTWKTDADFTAADPPTPRDIRVAPASLPFTCADTADHATAEEVEAAFDAPPPSSTVEVEKPVDPDEAHAGIMSAPKTAHRQAEFTRMKAVAQAMGSVPVIIELAVPNIVAMTSRSSAAAAQAELVQADGALSAAIAAVAQTELARLAAVPHAPGRVFPYIPFMSLRVSERALEILEASPTVLDINEDRLAEPSLDNTVNIVEASNSWTRGFDGAGWYVAILDTGIRATHNFFAGKDIDQACFSLGQDGSPGAGGCPNGLSTDTTSPNAARHFVTSPTSGHGTHIAGIAAGNDPLRVPPLYGVARAADIVAVQVFSQFITSPFCSPPGASCLLSYTSDQIAGLNHVYSLRFTHNLAAVNMSLSGGGPFNNQTDCDSDNSGTKAIIDSLRTAGIATVIATGNDGFCTGVGAPACISSAIAVGAVTDADVEPGFNNYGALLDLFAPGVSILSSVSSTNSAYASDSGTSMAAPHVTGAWAILKQACPSATVTEAFNALQSTGTVIANACTGIGTYPQRRIRINTAIDALCDQCTGESFTIFNDGGGTLEVTSIDIPSWAQLSPLPPYSIVGGASRQVCVTVDCGACAGEDLSGPIDVHSNDADEPTASVSLTVACPPVGPSATTWESMVTHARTGQTPIEVPLDIRDNANCTGAGVPYPCCSGAGTGTCTGSFSEPRRGVGGGINKLVITFDGPLDPATVIPANVTVCGNSAPPNFSPVDLSSVVVTTATTSGDTKMVINFAPALPNFARYRVVLSTNIQGAGGGAIQAGTGGLSRIMTALAGDLNSDRRVNSTDVGGIRSLEGRDPINPAILNDVRGDINNDKRIGATDVAGARSLSGNDARTIPDPVCP